MVKKRDRKIDVLRFIAIIGILIAHVNAPDFWMQLRSFDVPMMAFLMGVSFYVSSKDKEIDYKQYVIKRLKRLVIPTWQFLTLYIGGLTLVNLVLGDGVPFDLWTVVSSYLLLDGIGYVWIIGVFVVVALVNPIILKFSLRTRENSKYFLTLGVIYAVYIGLTLLNQYFSEIPAFFFEHLVLYTIAYGLVAAVGIRLKQLSKKVIWGITIGALLVYLVLAFANDFALVSTAKYPPTTYYISYAVGSIFGLSLLLELKPIFKVFNNSFVFYISENSMWFYLWHIIPVTLLAKLEQFIPILEASWELRFLFVFITTTVLTVGHTITMKKVGEFKAERVQVTSET